MKVRLQRFMAGRYGVDDFGRFLNVLILAFLLISILVLPELLCLGVGLLAYQYYRILSRNIQARAAENGVYLKLRGRIQGWAARNRQHMEQRRIYHFYRCPACRQRLRIPRGKGKVSITCPNCQAQFMKKS